MNKILYKNFMPYLNFSSMLVLIAACSLSAKTWAYDNPLFIEKLGNISTYKAKETPVGTESLCGNNDLQHIESYDGRYTNLGFDRSFTLNIGATTGAIKSTNSVSAPSYCSGTLLSNNNFLTASHCVGTNTVGDYVAFGYQRIDGSGALRSEQVLFRVSSIVEDGAYYGLDYAVLRLAGTPNNSIAPFPGAWGGAFGSRDVQGSTPEDALISQHPSGEPKQVEGGSGISRYGSFLYYSDIDTLPGSSGSGVLDKFGQVVGVHTNGGCGASSGSNSGVAMDEILSVSSVINTSPTVNISMSYDGEERTVHWDPVPGASYYVLSNNSYSCYRVLDSTVLSYTSEMDAKYLTTSKSKITAMQGTKNNQCRGTKLATSRYMTYCELYPTSSNCNIAGLATASAQSTFSGYSASKINDGSTSTTVGGQYSWTNGHTYTSNGRLPNWVQLDFGGNKRMSKVVLYTSSGYQIKDYDIEIWNGSRWVTVVQQRGNTSVKRTHTFTATTGSKIRVMGLRGPDNQSVYVRVNELEVYP